MKIEYVRNLNSEALAYMGDAVYEEYVRRSLIEGGMQRVNNLHKAATRYVKASAQAEIIRTLIEGEELCEEEIRLVKRARNHRFNSKAKNADPVTYKWATAFEALVGYLYLIEDESRLNRVMARALEIIDGK